MNRLIALGFVCVFFLSCKPEQGKETSGLNENLPNGYAEGKVLFKARCAVCHGESGKPKIKLYPPIKNSSYLRNHPEKIPCIIRFGLNEKITVNEENYDMKMAGNPDFSAEQISHLINYMNNSWGNSFGETTTQEVIKLLKNCEKQ